MGTSEEMPLDGKPEEEALVADPVDSHSKESVPESPRLLEMYSLFFGTKRTDPATIEGVNKTVPWAASAGVMRIIRTPKITHPAIKINDLSALNKRLFVDNEQNQIKKMNQK